MNDPELKSERKKNLQAFKRQRVLDAAAELFRLQGLEGTTMRAIAKKAGYSTGAPYAYFQSKEDIYAELLTISLANLTKSVKGAERITQEGQIRAIFAAYFNYYLDNPEELQLGLYLFSSGEVKKRGFSEGTNDLLNGRLIALLGFMANSLHNLDGVGASLAQQETLDAITYFTGALILHSTGRLEIMGASPQEMIDRYISQMLERLKQ